MEKIKVTSFIYHSHNHPLSNGNTAIVDVLQFLSPKMFPTEFSFNVSFGLYDLFGHETIEVRYVFRDPNNEIVNDTNNIMVNIQQPEAGSANHVGAQMALELRNVILKMPGIYTSEVYVNNELLGSYPIDVVQSK